MSEMRPFVSVIIPVFNDTPRLLKCLAKLESQSYPTDRYEVLVVDNGSADDLTSAVAGFAHVRTFREEQPSSYSARNRGVREARGDIFAFTDADCLPANDWLTNGVDGLVAANGCGLLAGRIDVFWEPDHNPSAVELYDSVRGLAQKHYVNAKGFGATANVFTWRNVLEAVGPFDTTLKSCGDMEWGRRVSRSGYQIVYSDAAVVAHPARKTLRELSGKMRRVAGGLRTLSRKPGVVAARPCRNGSFLHELAEVLHDILHDPRLKRRRDTLKVLAVTFYVEMVKVSESIRLSLGGQPLR